MNTGTDFLEDGHSHEEIVSMVAERKAQERSMATRVTEMAVKFNELADRLGKEAGFKEASIIHAISVAKKARLMTRNVTFNWVEHGKQSMTEELDQINACTGNAPRNT